MFVCKGNDRASQYTARNRFPLQRHPHSKWSQAAFLLLWLCALASPLKADMAPSALQPNHIYVNYTSDNIPCAKGNLKDVTGTLQYSQDHVYDLYGNRLAINRNNTLNDDAGQVVGFVYACSATDSATATR